MLLIFMLFTITPDFFTFGNILIIMLVNIVGLHTSLEAGISFVNLEIISSRLVFLFQSIRRFSDSLKYNGVIL